MADKGRAVSRNNGACNIVHSYVIFIVHQSISRRRRCYNNIRHDNIFSTCFPPCVCNNMYIIILFVFKIIFQPFSLFLLLLHIFWFLFQPKDCAVNRSIGRASSDILNIILMSLKIFNFQFSK